MNQENEKIVLHMFTVDNSLLSKTKLNSNDFSLDKHREIFDFMKKKGEFDMPTIIIKFKEIAIGISEMADYYPTVNHFKTYEKELIAESTNRKIQYLAEKLIKNPQDKKIVNTINKLKERFEEKEEKEFIDPIGIINKPYTWGTKGLDNEITPIARNHFIILVGESGAGKTAYTFDMALKNAELGHKVHYLSLEMETENIFVRIARSFAGITKYQWRDKELIIDAQKTIYHNKIKELKEIKTFYPIGGAGSKCDINWIIGKIKQSKSDLFFIDNMDLIMKDTDLTKLDNEEDISKRLSDITNELQIPVILVHHFKKGNDKSGARGIDSVRGSGKITHNADNVIITKRNKYEEDMSDLEKAEFFVSQLKDRDFGELGYGKVYFHKGSFYDEFQIPNF